MVSKSQNHPRPLSESEGESSDDDELSIHSGTENRPLRQTDTVLHDVCMYKKYR